MTRKARADATNNRDHIVAVAHAAFAADGLELPVRELARRAGLGVATLYRHFPSKPDLVEAVLVTEIARCEADLQAALSDADPWRALCSLITRFADQQVRNRGLNEALLGSHSAGVAFADQRAAHANGLRTIVNRALAAGSLREGMGVGDVRIGLSALSSFRSAPTDTATVAVPRLAGLIIAGLAR